jgi:hypothetical protein
MTSETTPPAEYREYTVQVLIEADGEGPLTRSNMAFTEGRLVKALEGQHGLNYIITVTNEDEEIVLVKPHNPSEKLKERAWK